MHRSRVTGKAVVVVVASFAAGMFIYGQDVDDDRFNYAATDLRNNLAANAADSVQHLEITAPDLKNSHVRVDRRLSGEPFKQSHRSSLFVDQSAPPTDNTYSREQLNASLAASLPPAPEGTEVNSGAHKKLWRKQRSLNYLKQTAPVPRPRVAGNGTKRGDTDDPYSQLSQRADFGVQDLHRRGTLADYRHEKVGNYLEKTIP